MRISGDPEQIFGRIAVRDVALVLASLGDGLHPRYEIHRLVQSVTPNAVEPYNLGVILSALTFKSRMVDGVQVHKVTMETCRRRWPRLPWDEVEQASDAEMSPRPVSSTS